MIHCYYSLLQNKTTRASGRGRRGAPRRRGRPEGYYYYYYYYYSYYHYHYYYYYYYYYSYYYCYYYYYYYYIIIITIILLLYCYCYYYIIIIIIIIIILLLLLLYYYYYYYYYHYNSYSYFPQAMEARPGQRAALAGALHELMNVRVTRGEPQDARRVAQAAKAVCRELGDWGGEAAVLAAEARCHFRERSAAEGVEVCAQMLAIYRREGQRRREAELLQEVAEVQLARTLPSKALAAAEAARELFQALGDVSAAKQAKELAKRAEEARARMKEIV